MPQSSPRETGTMINVAATEQWTILVIELVDGGTMIVRIYVSTICTSTPKQSTSMAKVVFYHSLKSKSDQKTVSFDFNQWNACVIFDSFSFSYSNRMTSIQFVHNYFTFKTIYSIVFENNRYSVVELNLLYIKCYHNNVCASLIGTYESFITVFSNSFYQRKWSATTILPLLLALLL